MPLYLAEALSRRVGRPVTLADIGLGVEDGHAPPFGSDPIGSIIDLGKADLDRRNMLYSVGLLPLSMAYLAEASERGTRIRELRPP
jgi:hypothetical protein